MDEKRVELDRLIARVEQHRVALGLSHARFSVRYRKCVGSQKTWENRLLPRKWNELNLDVWLGRLRKFVLELDGAVGDQEIFENLPIVRYAALLYDTLQSQENDRRCGMLVGTQGTGKTLALQFLRQSNKTLPVFLSANETWKDSRMRIATALATGVNATVSGSASQTFQNAVEALKSNPLTLLIDEAHEGGVLLMKLVKSIINETRARIILSIYPTAWRRLLNGANDAYSEAQQLLRRTVRPVRNDWIYGLGERDMAEWFSAVKLPALKPRALDLLPLVRRHGNYSLLADALDRAQIIAGEDDGNVTADLFCRQVHELSEDTTREAR